MGTLTKRLGQLASRSLESESANILKTSRANKVQGSLSQGLDATLKDGHDMKVFGLGTAAALANRPRYGRFTVAMHAVYTAMEEQLDRATAAPVKRLWTQHRDTLQRSGALRADLADIGIDPDDIDLTTGTCDYLESIKAAGCNHEGAGLVGHLYCRYLADLFGGQMLGTPTKVALALPVSPRHYCFNLETPRREYIESLYESINQAGEEFNEQQFQAAIDSAYGAFRHNAIVYAEEPLMLDASRGVRNIVMGYVRQMFDKC